MCVRKVKKWVKIFFLTAEKSEKSEASCLGSLTKNVLKYNYSCVLASLERRIVPDARLHLADVGASHHKHTQT